MPSGGWPEAALALARNEAYQSMLEQSLRVFTRRVGDLLNAERASYGVADYLFAISQLAQTTLRAVLGKHDLVGQPGAAGQGAGFDGSLHMLRDLEVQGNGAGSVE